MFNFDDDDDAIGANWFRLWMHEDFELITKLMLLWHYHYAWKFMKE